MNLIKRMLLGGLFLSWILSVQGYGYANNDYVCSYYQTSCSCTWETSWRADGTKHCVGTRQTGTRIGNTRVGCPSTTTSTTTVSNWWNQTCITDPITGEQSCTPTSTTYRSGGAYGTVDYFNNGGYMFGDVWGGAVSCDIVKYDSVVPIASANANSETGITGYNGTITTNTACDMANGPSNPSDCTPVTNGSGSTTGYNGTITTNTACDMANGPSNPSDCTPVTKITWHTFHPLCTDNESGCKPVPADFKLNNGESKKFTVYDKAKNSASCTAYGDGTFGGCSGIIFPGNDVIPTNSAKCTFANGVNCTPDHAAPIAQISYSPASCTKTDVSVVNSCIRDIDDSGNSPWSGCRWAPENKATLAIASNQAGTLGIADGAGNIKDLAWNIDWIDKTPPYALQFATENQKAGNSNVFAISGKDDSVAAGCGEGDLSFRLDISGTETRTINGKTPRDGTVTTAMLGLTKKGNYAILVTITDQAGNSINTTYNNLTIYPADPDASKSSVTLISPSSNSLYADNTSQYRYTLTLKDAYDNPINSKGILINQETNGTAGFKTVKTDMTDPSSPAGSDALNEGWTWTTDNNGELTFTLKSTTPGVFTERFKLSLKKWGNDYVDTNTDQSISVANGNENSFKKPFIGGLSITTPPYNLSLGTVLTMQLGITPKSGISPSYTIDQFKDQISLADNTNQELLDQQDAIQLVNSNPLIDFRIGAKTDAWVNMVPSVAIQGNPVISYILWWQNIRYRLSATDSASDAANLSIWWIQINSLRVVWTLQWQGKQTLAWQQSNFSDISKSDMRAIIRKNAYTLIRGMSSGQIVGGVRYIEGNTTLSWEPSYETLIVKNGNLSITGNFNTSSKKFGIIVLRDDATKTGLGNIYVQPGVRYIESAVYADGGMISTGFSNDTVGNYKDSAARTATLNKQLVINGAMFTRNTIGWAIKGSSGKYILPGGATTTDFNLAMMYDLNYLRRGNEWYNISGINGTKSYNKGNTDNVVIISNPNLQTNPPKGFKN